jgi:hypothetical protein
VTLALFRAQRHAEKDHFLTTIVASMSGAKGTMACVSDHDSIPHHGPHENTILRDRLCFVIYSKPLSAPKPNVNTRSKSNQNACKILKMHQRGWLL